MRSRRSERIAPPATSTARRGLAIIALVLVILVVGLLIIGSVQRGAREIDLAVTRLDTTRALYATEAGANMALRERILNSDADGDGGIGTISNDGNSANNPAFGTASVYVTSSTS